MSTKLSGLVPSNLQKWFYNLSGFNQYGLRRDDMLDEKRADVQEALRRLPKDLRDERNFRIVRALQLDFQKRVLPKSEWTQLENDPHYLMPYVKEVWRENAEKDAWNSQ